MSEVLRDVEFDKPGEECGVFGIYAPGSPVAELTYLGLLALQHRGQDAAGIAVVEDNGIIIVKNLGKVERALNDGNLIKDIFKGYVASGHVRYSTNSTDTDEQRFLAAGPMHGNNEIEEFALSHNGNIANFDELRRDNTFIPEGFMTDSGLITELINEQVKNGLPLHEALMIISKQLNGAYSLVLTSEDELLGMRDPKGFRPLMLGSRGDNGWVLASEIPALDIVRAKFVREIEPGEVIRINKNGVASYNGFSKNEINQRLCAFEFIYFSRPDNELLGVNVETARFKMGQELAKQRYIDADIVVGVPDSGISAAEGYAHMRGLPKEQGLVKNKYVGRTFIVPGQDEREQATWIKLNVNKKVVAGKRLIVPDDSIVRGTTTRVIVEMLREAGATEVHLVIASSPYKWPCFYGMNTGNITKLIASELLEEQICKEVGADSLTYLSLEGLRSAIGSVAAKKLCYACMDGDYPTDITDEMIYKYK